MAMPPVNCLTMPSLRAIIFGTSIAASLKLMPCCSNLCSMFSYWWVESSSALEGTQPTRRQVPPRAGLPSLPRAASTQAVFRPSWAARMAAWYPAGPAPMTTTSNCSLMKESLRFPSRRRREGRGGSRPGSEPQQHPVRILELVLDVHQEQHGILAVDDAVVVAQGDVHHRRDHDLAVLGDRTLLDGVHAE